MAEGILSGITGWMKDDTNRMRLAGLGEIFGAMDQGQQANISPFLQAIGQSEKDQAFKNQLQNDPMMAKFNAEERSFLTTLPPQLAQKMIAERMFAKPEPTTYGWQTMQDGSLIRTDSQGGFQQMGAFAKPAGSEVPASFTALDLQAKAAGLQPDTPEYQQFMMSGGRQGGGDGPAAFQALHMQAEAAGFPAGTPEYQQFMATRGAGYVEAAKSDAKNTSDARAALPGARGMADDISKQIDGLLSDPYLDSMLGPVNSRLPNVSADAARVQGRIDQLQGGAFLQARQMLKGGGAITDFEGQKAEAAFVRMGQAQSRQDFELALREFQDAVNSGVAKLEKSMAENPAPQASALQTAVCVIAGVAVLGPISMCRAQAVNQRCWLAIHRQVDTH